MTRTTRSEARIVSGAGYDIDGPVRPYEALAAGVGLSLTFREREGRGTLALDGELLAEAAFRGPA